MNNKMFKKSIILILCSCIISSCGIITKEEIDKADELCKTMVDCIILMLTTLIMMMYIVKMVPNLPLKLNEN